MRVFFVLLSFMWFFQVGHSEIESPFPEEAQRKLWDRGCLDWPSSLSDEKTLIKKNPEIICEKSGGYFRVFARVFVKGESGESLDDIHKSMEKMLSQGGNYADWVLPGINEKATGGRYFVSVEGLTSQELRAQERYILTGPYKFKVFWFEREGMASLEFRRKVLEESPSCPLFQDPSLGGKHKLTKFTYRMTPRPELLELLMTEIWLIPRPEERGVELRLRLAARPSKLVYELMPEALLVHELEARGKRLFENFYELRRHEAWLRAAKVSSDPLWKALQK